MGKCICGSVVERHNSIPVTIFESSLRGPITRKSAGFFLGFLMCSNIFSVACKAKRKGLKNNILEASLILIEPI